MELKTATFSKLPCTIFAALQRSPRFKNAAFSAIIGGLTVMEERRVDIAIKLNVLAVCAAFVFVSAILLGAF
jgi:hypothetical protein